METLSLFLFKSIVVSGLLTTWYLLALRGTRLHKYNRIFLLSTLFASLVIPFFHFQLFSIHHSITSNLAPVSLFGSAGTGPSGSLNAIKAGQAQINWMLVAGIFTGAVSLGLLSLLSFRIAKVRKMCSN